MNTLTGTVGNAEESLSDDVIDSSGLAMSDNTPAPEVEERQSPEVERQLTRRAETLNAPPEVERQLTRLKSVASRSKQKK